MIIDFEKYNKLFEELHEFDFDVRQQVFVHPITLQNKLNAERGKLEAVLRSFEALSESIQEGRTLPLAPLTQAQLNNFGSELRSSVDMARRTWDQPEGMYSADSLVE